MAGPPYQVLVDRLGGSPTFGRGELIDAETAAAMHLQATRLAAAGAIVGLGPDTAPLLAGYTGSGLLSARPAVPDVPAGATAFYFATDTRVLSRWDGSAWHDSGVSVLKFENWDGVSAPAIPAGWAVDSQLETRTNLSPTSAPNSLVYPVNRGDSALVPQAVWTTPDTNGGNVRVSATVRFTSTAPVSQQTINVFARSQGLGGFGSAAQYIAIFEVDTGSVASLQVRYVLSGQTVLGRVTLVPYADNTDYRIVLICNGPAIQAQCQRLSDSYWLNSSGAFVSDPTNSTLAISVTDTSLAGAGYAGLGYYLGNAEGGDIGADDWLLEAL